MGTFTLFNKHGTFEVDTNALDASVELMHSARVRVNVARRMLTEYTQIEYNDCNISEICAIALDAQFHSFASECVAESAARIR